MGQVGAGVDALLRESELHAQSAEDQRQWLGVALKLLAAARPAGNPQDVRTWTDWEPLHSHIALAVQAADEREIADPTSLLMNELGQLLQGKALHSQAEPLMRRALEIFRESLGDEHASTLTVAENHRLLLEAMKK